MDTTDYILIIISLILILIIPISIITTLKTEGGYDNGVKEVLTNAKKVIIENIETMNKEEFIAFLKIWIEYENKMKMDEKSDNCTIKDEKR